MFEVGPKERKRARADQGGKIEDIYVLAVKKSMQKRQQIDISKDDGG